MNFKPLNNEFYNRDTITVAKELLGKIIICKKHNKAKACRIVETEAYLIGDPASHSYKGQTKRNQSMFKDPGTLYVYIIHRQNCMNIVTKKGEAVLIRAAEPLYNIDKPTNGPGKLCAALGITRIEDDGKNVINSNIIIVDDGWKPQSIECSKRIGVTKAKDLLLRFYIKGNKYVSR